jgi:hypothetical protein
MSAVEAPAAVTAMGGGGDRPCHVVDYDSPTGTLCGTPLPTSRMRSTHLVTACPKTGGACVLCPECARLIGQ